MTSAPVVDPVCRTPLPRWDQALDRRHGGLAYHFCSPQCSSRFSAAPERFTGPGLRPAVRRARQRVALPIFGLGCGGGGATTIERWLRRVPGVLRVYVNPATETAYVDFHPGLLTPDDLVDVIEEAGYRSLRAEHGRHRERTDSR